MENFNLITKDLENLHLYKVGETSQHPQQQRLISPANTSGNTANYPTIRNYSHQLRTRLHALLTAVEGEGRVEFNDMVSRNYRRELYRFVSMLTSESTYFFEIINDKEGSKRVKNLLGKSHETDEIFLNAIVNRFIDIMTGKYSYHVALEAINVFNDAKSSVLVNLTLRDTLYLASDKIGCVALNKVITGSNVFVRREFLKEIAENADWLSMDDSENFVVQHALKFRNLECTNHIAFRLYAYYVELASQKHSSYIVEQILDSNSRLALDLTVSELLKCGGNTLLRLARNVFGNYVVQKALRVTWREHRDLFFCLIAKLEPFIDLLHCGDYRFYQYIIIMRERERVIHLN